MLAVIRVSRGPHSGVSRALMPGQRAMIGCGNWSHFPVDDASIGDPQFLLRHDGSSITVTNLSETAMLFVNGLRSMSRRLSDGDVISVGDCEFTVEIRGAHGHLGHLNLPLVGSVQLSEEHGLSVRLTQTLEQRTGGNRITIHPDFWTESVRLRNRGSGVPTLQMLKNVSRRRPCGVIVNTSVMREVRTLPGILPEGLTPIPAEPEDAALLWVVDSVSIQILHTIVDKFWATHDVLFFVPVDSSPRYRNRFTNSTLWTHRNVEQLTLLLMAGTMTVRESAFRFLDALLLPTVQEEPGWTLLSTVRVDTQPRTEPGIDATGTESATDAS